MSFGVAVVLTAAAGLAAVLSSRVTARIRIPVAALLLVAAAVVVEVVPDLHAPPERTVERLVTVALVCVLFDGGMHIGWRRFRAAGSPIGVVGVLGTFLTVAGAALFLWAAVGLAWYPALLVATAVAPTDPAVVFSVLGQREVSGRAGTVLEGESGANDPVGIALMTSLLAAGAVNATAFGRVTGEFAAQMAVGAAVGVAGGTALLWFIRRVPLPSEGLYPLRTLAAAFVLFGLATVAHGSGFLAVFVAGILLGDARAPYKREIEHFHAALGSLAEIVAFVALGLTVDLHDIVRLDVWLPGLALWAVVTAVVRPLAVGLTLTGSGLPRNERAFILFAGLKGAVPILLGSFLLGEHVADADRLYAIIVVVVVLSVVVQGSLVPTVARLLRVPMRARELEPWSLGVRLRSEPAGARRFTVARGSGADGRTVGQLADDGNLPGDAWVSIVVRAGQLVPVTDDTRLAADDQVLVLCAPESDDALAEIFQTARDMAPNPAGPNGAEPHRGALAPAADVDS
jgi:cell volume regulation protein A